MDLENFRRKKKAEIEQRSHQRAVDEILALKAKHAQDLTYAFECKGQPVEGAFLIATFCQELRTANAYQIELLVLPHIVVEGQCHITDTKGKRVAADGETIKSEKENRVLLKTLALE